MSMPPSLSTLKQEAEKSDISRAEYPSRTCLDVTMSKHPGMKEVVNCVLYIKSVKIMLRIMTSFCPTIKSVLLTALLILVKARLQQLCRG